jgi:hypothetical protein
VPQDWLLTLTFEAVTDLFIIVSVKFRKVSRVCHEEDLQAEVSHITWWLSVFFFLWGGGGLMACPPSFRRRCYL